MNTGEDARVGADYRQWAGIAGFFIGGVAGIVAAGPYFREWPYPLLGWLGVALGCAIAGALIGCFFIHILVGSEASRGVDLPHEDKPARPGRGEGLGDDVDAP